MLMSWQPCSWGQRKSSGRNIGTWERELCAYVISVHWSCGFWLGRGMWRVYTLSAVAIHCFVWILIFYNPSFKAFAVLSQAPACDRKLNTRLLYPFLCWWICFSCVHVLTIVNSAVNIEVHMSFWVMIFSGCMPRSGIVQVLCYIFSFLGNLHSVLHSDLCCSVAQSYPTFCNPMDCSMPGLPVPHHLLNFAQVHIHCISYAIQPSQSLMPSPPPALNRCQHQGLFQWVSCSHQVARVLELQLQWLQLQLI